MKKTSRLVPFIVIYLCQSTLAEDLIPTQDAVGKTPSAESSGCEPHQFQCDSGECIPIIWHCNSQRDCKDGSDERCPVSRCPAGQFTCAVSKKCLPKGWLCDGEPDCGVDSALGEDISDENPTLCKTTHCKWNEARCPGASVCAHLDLFCDGKLGACPGNSDEWNFCRNKSVSCDRMQCTYKCKPTPQGPQCYCPEGKRPDGINCVDANECVYDETCSQICTNTEGSFKCSCVSGYYQNGTNCIAINVPETEPPSLIFSTQVDVRRVTLDGKPWPGHSTLDVDSSTGLEFIHRNHTVCFVYPNKPNKRKYEFGCANINDLKQRWILQPRSPLIKLADIVDTAFDWVSGNWYFGIERNDLILVCNSGLLWCNIIVETDIRSPRSLAVDPTSGFVFFTKWGESAPMLERADLDGSNRTALVELKIVFPHGVCVDYATKYVYWADSYMDYVEKVDYYGNNRKSVAKRRHVSNIHGVSLFENRVFVSSWDDNLVTELTKTGIKASPRTIVSNVSHLLKLHVFHRQRQPDVAHPCKTSSCDHLCIPAWSHTGVAVKKCICATGYILFEDRCIIKTPDMFLLYSDRFTRSIRGKDLASGRDVMVPLMLDEEIRIFDVDVQTKSIIYYNRNHVISQVPIESTGSAKELIQLVFCDLPIVDWTTRNLYFHSFGSGYINVLDLANSTNIKALFKTSINEIETLIALDPTRGLIFFTNPNPVLSRSSIYRAYMDGTGYKTFLKEKVFNPSGLEVDIKGGRLYWLEYKLAILQSVNLDGNDLRIEIGKGLNNPYQLTIGPDGTLYFINVGNATVMSYKRGEGSKVAYKATPAIGHIKIYDANKIGNRPKQCDDCTGLCLRTVGGAVTCACRDGFQLAENMKDCVTDQNYIAPSACPKVKANFHFLPKKF
ncbi:low-density lipoprotein receptor-related protein 1 [Dendroctonus ponderosae]|uniref:low-density lipoprotein receptor-related protein 1 n=1 Tax=Dendroctonus ponderosae TaxID=77166 RepID=UPI00203652D1|nr:low-density lipoprotein receptor-related protein 1 [Dendroctonus ponderosae]